MSFDHYSEQSAFFNPTKDLDSVRGNLPHWRQERVSYFVTFRLRDSLPKEKNEEWKRDREIWLRTHPEPRSPADQREYVERFPRRLQRWLDQGTGSCVLSIPEVKTWVEAALRHFEGDRYDLDQFVVAANHVHALVAPRKGHELSVILHSWKSFTAHKIVKHPEAKKRLQESECRRNADEQKGRDATSTSQVVWQKESYDHIVRSRISLERIRNYIRSHDAKVP